MCQERWGPNFPGLPRSLEPRAHLLIGPARPVLGHRLSYAHPPPRDFEPWCPCPASSPFSLFLPGRSPEECISAKAVVCLLPLDFALEGHFPSPWAGGACFPLPFPLSPCMAETSTPGLPSRLVAKLGQNMVL